MAQNSGYHRNLARVLVRLYRPLVPAGRRRTRFDQVAARLWTRLDVLAYRHLGVSLGVRALGVADVLLLRTRGRLSGQVREVLVAYVVDDLGPVICAANGGSHRAPAWFGNVQSGGPVEIERHGKREVVVPRILVGVEREAAFAAVYRTFPHVRLYLEHTSRPFPVVRLEQVVVQADQVIPSGLESGDPRGRQVRLPT